MRRKIIGLAAFLALCVGCIDFTNPLPRLDPAADPADVAAAVHGNNAFALDLYAKLRSQEGNLFFSPYSISTALAMTRAGARGETAAAMDKTLHFTLPPDRQDAAFAALIREASQAHGCRLSVANALWGQKGAGFTPDFLNRTRDYYGAGLHEVDFRTDAEQARRAINDWVARQTRDKIKELIGPDMLGPDSRLVLTDAIYFKGDWASKFPKDLTRDEPFHLDARRQKSAPLMHHTDQFSYFDADGLQALEMPYVGKDLSMVVLLPKKVDGLAELEAGLTAEKLDGLLHGLAGREVVVTFPKFKAESSMELSDVLSGMGMAPAFSDGADFSGMNGGREPLKISDVTHKATIDTNEEGTEAAAATAVNVTLAAAPQHFEIPKPEFRADHPFLFLIRDTRSGSVLFLGRLADPAK
jgi:serpin B